MLGFVAEIEMAAVGSGSGPVVHLDAGDLADDRVRRRIDEMNVVAGGVGLHDADRIGLERDRNRAESNGAADQDEDGKGFHDRLLYTNPACPV